MTRQHKRAVWRVRLWRYVRRAPSVAWRQFRNPFADAGQLLSIAASIVALAIFLRQAGPLERDELASQWAVTIIAAAYTAIGWAIACVVSSPFVAMHEEARRGRWYGNRFVYHQPRLLTSQRCRASGKIERYPFAVDDIEPGSFFNFFIDVGPLARNRIAATVNTSLMLIGDSMRPGQSSLTGGTRLERDRRATLTVCMAPGTTSETIRAYCTDFVIGDINEHDGDLGDMPPIEPRFSGAYPTSVIATPSSNTPLEPCTKRR